MRRRILGLWRAGVKVFRLSDSLIVRLPESVLINSRRSPGLPFVRYGKVMSAFPLEKKDLAHFKDSGECLIFINEGNLETILWQDLKMEDAGEWFDLADFHVIETESLGGESAPTLTVMKTVSEADLNIREKLENVPSANSELGEIIAKLKELRENQTSASPGSLFQSGNDLAGTGGAMASFFTSVFGSFKNLFASGGLSSGANAAFSQQGGYQGAAQPNGPDAFARLYNRLRHLAVKAVLEMRMASIFGRRQAKYLTEMMEKFEQGDLSEALKYAIPLEDIQALQNLMQKPTSLFLPRPRADLSINLGQNVNGSSMNLGDEWFNHLREMYRKSFERLEAQGRIEEATFVLAELLKSNLEAVEFLAKHGKYRLAAELAEARNLPKETIVRQWYLAGEKMRAVRLAILHNCFEYAVTKLEEGNSEIGSELREVWAESLAASGNFSAAVDVIWKLEAKRALAKDWIEKTIEFGGAPAGRMLARKAMLFPEEFDEIKEEFRPILKGGDFESVEKRNAFARAVFKQNINDELRTLLRPLIRKISNDAVNTSSGLALKEFRELVVMAKDNALRTDLPPFPQVISPSASNQLFEISVSASDKGASFIYDACVLPDGRIALALGESGVKIFSGNAKQIAFFDQPAHKLIVSDFATKAIALAERGETVRLARIDFIERRAKYWCDTKLSAFASNFDGSIWFVGVSDEFYAIDANAKNFEALWRVSDVGGAVYAAVRSKTQVKFLTLDAKGFETWWYELPNLTLRSRNRRKWLENVGEDVLYAANISEGGHSAVIMYEPTEEAEKPTRFYALIFDHEHLARRFDFPPEITKVNRPEIFSQYSAITSYTANEAVINIFFGGGNLTATITLADAQKVSVKFDENHLTIADDCGRLLVYDYANRLMRRNLRF